MNSCFCRLKTIVKCINIYHKLSSTYCILHSLSNLYKHPVTLESQFKPSSLITNCFAVDVSLNLFWFITSSSNKTKTYYSKTETIYSKTMTCFYITVNTFSQNFTIYSDTKNTLSMNKAN